MIVYIPTYKRLHTQPTAEALAAAGVAVVLVVRPEEAKQALEVVWRLGNGARVMVLPPHVSNIGQTRQYIVEQASDLDYVIMMDDDLAFACRGKREDNPLYLSPCDPMDIRNMVAWLESTLQGTALAGISAREGNNRKLEDVERNSRLMRCWGLRRDVFFKTGASFENMDCMEDFDVMLTFLTNGHEILINNNYTTNQAGSNTEGGCSTYRTLEIQAKAAHALANKYPGLVKTVQKETKTSWGGGTRTDVVVYWKKAYQKGCTK